MTLTSRRSRLARLAFLVIPLAGGLAAARAQLLQADLSALRLEDYVVSATRTPQTPATVSSSVTMLPLPDLAAEQVTDLRTALAAEPGVVVVNTGAAGGQSSVFLRGASSHQTLFVVDGVRMSDRSAAYSNFLGGADLGGVDRIEVLRGPQSPLYGSSAMGGVILLDTMHGCAPFSGSLTATTGSFETRGASAAVQGGTKDLGYSAAVSRFETANDQPANNDRMWSYSARLEGTPTAALLVGATFRGQNSDYEDVGSRTYPITAAVASDTHLGTVYVQARAGETFTSQLTLAQHRRDYRYTTFGPWGYVSELKNRREILDWQNTWVATAAVEMIAGANFERSRYRIDGTETKDDVGAGFLSATVKPVADIVLTGGVRYDDFESVGDATTWRTGVAWLPAKGTKLRATYGTGFSAPGSDDRYGVPEWGQLASPGLKPEKSSGWDAGLDQDFLSGRGAVALTYFQNRFRNLFEWAYVNYVTYEGRTVNRSRASTNGVELATTAKLTAAVKTRLAYTYLEARDDENRTRLTRRPRHTLDGEVQVQATKPWLVGAGLHVVASRMNGVVAMEDYTTVRVFTSYVVRAGLLLKLRVENALDERYEEVFGYPALPVAAYGSVEWRF